ncbi:MAG: hypothetical protein PVI97_01185 [Candidatus Thiodiazotropha sp.]|jgi:hypothetical protein
MDNDLRKKRKLSDHALELIMRDVLHGLQEFPQEIPADAAMASPEEQGLISGNMQHTLESKKG